MNIKSRVLNLIKIDIQKSFIENKYPLLLSTLLFMIPLFLGYLFSSNLGEFLDPIIDNFKEKIINGGIKLTFDSIFINNFKAILFEYAGAILFGLITVAILIFNGLFIGYFASKIDLKTFLLGTVPHGIFEIPGLIIGATAGFILLYFLFNFTKDILIYNKDPINNDPRTYKHFNEDHYNDEYFKRYNEHFNAGISKRFSYSMDNNYKKLKQSIILFLIATTLLIIAAVVETQITVKIIHFFSLN
ncbi:MAG: stage II sporulation protein M [Methanobrevibacter sp.]|jgi:uncharacterized membrane protein SpoIIM required for sporulation|nr:stage II sporulation protein M [Methanobrevibacter sp.]